MLLFLAALLVFKSLDGNLILLHHRISLSISLGLMFIKEEKLVLEAQLLLAFLKVLNHHHQKNLQNFSRFQLSFKMLASSYQPSLQPIHLVIVFKTLFPKVHH